MENRQLHLAQVSKNKVTQEPSENVLASQLQNGAHSIYTCKFLTGSHHYVLHRVLVFLKVKGRRRVLTNISTHAVTL